MGVCKKVQVGIGELPLTKAKLYTKVKNAIVLADLVDTNLNTGEQQKGCGIYFLCYTKKGWLIYSVMYYWE